MIARTNEFKSEIAKLGREIDFKIAIHINDKIITQDNKFLITQDNMHLLVEQYNEEEVDAIIYGEDIYNVSVVRNGNLLSTMMKEVDFEINEDLRIGNVVDCSFGLKVDNDYEYIDYGRYIIYSKERNEDTDTYSYVAYDSMLFSMVEVDDTSIIQGVTVKTAIENICNKVGLSVTITAQDVTNLPNLNKTINEHTFDNINMTYRDVLDQICQCLGVSMVSDGKVLYLKTLNRNIVDTFDEEYLKSINVTFNEKYMINSVVLSRSEDTDTIYRRDDESVFNNGVHEFKIKDNLIMNFNDREDYIDEIFDQLNGVEYYLNDFSSTGITYLEPLDFYNIMIGDKTYRCLLLNDEINIDGGLEENIYTEQPEETTTNYMTSSKTDKEVSFIVDKQGGQINAKVSKGDVINEINLDESGASINAEKISLAGKTIQLTSDDIKISSTKFSVDENGNINSTGGDIGGFKIDANKLSKSVSGLCDYDYFDYNIVPQIVMNYIDVPSSVKNVFDVNNSGDIQASDYAIIKNIVNGLTTNTKEVSGKFEINSNNPKKCLQIKNDNDNIIVSAGVSGIETALLNANAIVVGVDTGSYQTNQISLNGTTGNIRCVSLTQTSLEENKKNFTKLKSGLDIIKDIDIYKYNYQNEDDKDKQHIGLVIGDKYKYSKEVTSINNDGIDLYSFVSVCCKAIQEQQEQINSLKEEIKQLKESDK